MALPTTSPSDWHPCKGCTCMNHTIPSYKFSATDADVPLTDHPDPRKLARSNDAPDPSEEQALQWMISDSGKHVDALDAPVLELKALRQAFERSIGRVDEELAALEKERHRFSDGARERQSVLSALRRMPREILAHIFFHTHDFPFPQRLKSLSGLWQSVSTASRHPLQTFELASRNWKNVLDTFSYLWSYVDIFVDRMYSIAHTRYIGNQLPRSRVYPLSVSISHSDSITISGPPAFPDLMLATLFPISSRIQTLCLPGNDFADMQRFHLSSPATLSELHSLTLSSGTLDSPVMIPSVLNSLTLPSLLDLSVTCIPGSIPPDQTGTFTSIRQLTERSHSPLTSLHFHNGPIKDDDLIHILFNTPTLQDLQLMTTDGITDEVLNHLARRVDTASDSQIPALVPHLHTLHLSGCLNCEEEVYVQMIEFRWTCHPRHLKSVCFFNYVWEYDGGLEAAGILALSRLDALRSDGLNVVMRS
ncbi:hypothetical protein EDD18DRAFT_144472 [Armillaria luteobubalina]|uniref:F-box domain-containing protein n=1 Tax=Armillaria luteobubalina TaxID=153913 RepID=A0AA39UPM5_9AGAR|nr:hypothetical protein EDD18DRAFT_144472 [Armillaria luteobubalina]